MDYLNYPSLPLILRPAIKCNKIKHFTAHTGMDTVSILIAVEFIRKKGVL